MTDRPTASDSNPQSPEPPNPAPILSYSSVDSIDTTGRTVRVGRYGSEMEAALPAALLESTGIHCEILNSNVNSLGPYIGMAPVELLVHETDVDAAREILSRRDDELEPVDDPADALPILGGDGLPIHLVQVASFENIRAFREAVAVLASARLRVFPPALRVRGDRPSGAGKRFVLKVAEQDRERAGLILDQARAEADADEDPRCPKCNSWRVYPVSRFIANVKAFFGMGSWPQKQIECLACRHRGLPSEFGIEE